MTVIAWDGRTLAADRQAQIGDVRQAACKLRRLENGEAAAWSGHFATARQLLAWYEAGADPAKWPAIPDDDERFCRLVIAGRHWCRYYERTPYAFDVLDPFAAFGSGREVAIGALAMGADARRAVEVAIQHVTSCGMGVDAIDFDA